MKDPRMKGVEQSQPGFKKLKRAASSKSERRSTTRKHGGHRRGHRSY